jgi:hypothetical protein
MWAARLAFVADASHGLGMTTTKAIEMTTEMANFETLTQAALRVDEDD